MAIVVGALAAMLIADRVAVVCVQGRIAARAADPGFSARPRVAIAGFRFLTQLAARRPNKVVVSAARHDTGPVEVKRLDSPCTAGSGRPDTARDAFAADVTRIPGRLG